MARCAVLIDGGYLDRVQSDDYGNVRVDIGKLGDELAGQMERLRTYYYHCMPFQSTNPTPEERTRHAAMDSFIFNLKKLPRFQFRQGKLQRIGNEYKQKRVDILMAVDLVRMSAQQQIEKAIIITGDSDLVPAIESARDSGVVVVVYYSPNSRHDELLQACDERYEITRNLIEKTKLVSVPAQRVPASSAAVPVRPTNASKPAKSTG
ncbi:MAG: NYN domain-containing protein [Acidobacteria bacterium]|nr:MAG: NYN domain-containing protein [Acidobacteriota bacterium]